MHEIKAKKACAASLNNFQIVMDALNIFSGLRVWLAICNCIYWNRHVYMHICMYVYTLKEGSIPEELIHLAIYSLAIKLSNYLAVLLPIYLAI